MREGADGEDRGNPGDFASLIEAFLVRRTRERLTRGQVNSNRRALFLLLSAVRRRLAVDDARPIPVTAVTLEDLLSVLAGLREKGRANGTVSSYASAFRLFFGDLHDRGLLLFDPARRLPSISEDHLP